MTNETEIEEVQRGMTNDDVGAHLHRVLPEFLEGYLLIGRNPATEEMIVRYWTPTKESARDLNAVIRALSATDAVRFSENCEIGI